MLRESIRGQIVDLKESLDLDAVLDLLLQNKVITVSQYQQLLANQRAEGMPYASNRLLGWVLMEQIEVQPFIVTVGEKLPWIREKIEHSVRRTGGCLYLYLVLFQNKMIL